MQKQNFRASEEEFHRLQISSCTQHVWSYLATMDWQQLASLAIVSVAAALLLRSKLQRPKLRFARNTPCGCFSNARRVGSPPPSIIYHARKGERGTILVRSR